VKRACNECRQQKVSHGLWRKIGAFDASRRQGHNAPIVWHTANYKDL
jgi:hypothetical protein